MIAPIEYLLNSASETEIAAHLRACDGNFVPRLSSRIEIGGYAKKISSNAVRFEAWSACTLIGLVAAYCNNPETRLAYITSVSVLHEWTGKGIAANLMDHCIKHAKASGMRQISLEVAKDNALAIGLYLKSGFVATSTNAALVNMTLYLKHLE
ncbi:MAG TPA: GNAT family N-acetyltransferase [Noviherbaspirillum sp.]|nr:GNAT family N-acetyltransferase [Noviherbaspirillum sp.]